MGILGNIVKILTRDLLGLEIMNSTMCKLFHVYGIVVSMFWDVDGEVHMLLVQLFGKGVGIHICQVQLCLKMTT